LGDVYYAEETATFDQAAFAKWAQEMNANTIDEFRKNRGRVAAFSEGPLQPLLFTHTGRKSGKSYTTPIVHMKAGDRYVIIGSMGSSPVNPQWFHNIVANPIVVLEVADERFTARARVAEGAERDELFAMMAAVAPEFERYSHRTTRKFPVVAFERVDATPALAAAE